MSPERWRQIEELYEAAQARGLEALAEADPELRREVEELLTQTGKGTGLLDRTATVAWKGAALPAIGPGTQLGIYRIEAPIGEGGMGQVFRAIDTNLNRPVAIKILSGQLADADARRRFQREAQMASSLNHPYILTVYDAGEIEGRQYLVTELVDGGTLGDWVKQETRTWRQIVELLTGVADALAAAHKANILHRDIKPANILVTASGYAKLADFGLAKLAEFASSDATTRDSITRAGTVIGTIPYMSPEQASGLRVDARSDIFSFGAVLYEMLAGRRAFVGKAGLEVLQKVIHEAPDPLTPNIPRAVRDVVAKALEKDPAARYQSMNDVVADLRRIARNAPDAEVPAAARPRRALRLGLPLAAVAAIVALAAGWHFWPRAAAAPQIHSIAVLPLKNLSDGAGQDFIAEGATEELIANLGQIHAFDKVISRTSTAHYATSPKPMPEIGRELDVDAIVEGSIQRSAGRTRVRVQLIRAATDAQLWSRAYDRDGSDILGIQAEVARAIAQEIRAQITPQENRQLDRAGSISPQAQEAYLLGSYHVKLSTEESLRLATEYFGKAAQLQPGYAAAYAGLGRAWQRRGVLGDVGFKNAEPYAREAANRALELDPNSATGHSVHGYVLLQYDSDWETGEKEMRRALELDPNDVEALESLSDLLTARARFPEALALRQRALARDPLSAGAYSSYGRSLYRARRYDEALVQLKRATELEPAADLHLSRMGDVYIQTGNLKEALRIREQLAAQFARAYDVAALAHLYALTRRRREAEATLKKAMKFPRPNAAAIALTYATLGDKNRAFEWLEKTASNRSFVMFWRVDPMFDPFRSDPRFEALLTRLKIPK